MTQTIEELLGIQWDILGHGLCDGYTEIRKFANGAVQKFCASKEEFIDVAKDLIEKKEDVYAGVNPRNTNSGRAIDIHHVTCVVLDLDPVRPKDTASTELQHKQAIELATKITSELGRGLVATSGSGAHVYFPIAPIKVTNAEALTKSLKLWSDLMRDNYATKEIRIDAIHDLPRVIRLWGSFNNKSKRVCGPITQINSFERWNHAFSQVAATSVKADPTTDEAIEERFNILKTANKRLGDLVEGNIKFPSRSEADMSFVAILYKAHFSVEEIKKLVQYNAHGRKEECDERQIKRIIDVVRKESESNSYSLRNSSDSYFNSLSNRKMGISTGFTSLDEMVSGLKPGKLYIIAARPNIGKTSLITQILLNIAEKGKTCLFYPTEVGSEPIFDKIISQKTMVSLKKFQNGTFTEADMAKIKEERPKLADLPLIVVEDFGLTVDKIEQSIRTFAPDVIAIDYFQAMKFIDPDSVGEKNEAVRRIKALAISTQKPIILASQLNRGDGKNDLRQLKGAGALEELGDVITYLSPGSTVTYPVPYELNIMKSKYSATGIVNLMFHRTVGKFTDNGVQSDESVVEKETN